MFEPFILKGLAAGIGIALTAGGVGCFVVWRRMAYFGDSLAHSALLGVALGFATGLSTHFSTVIVCSAFALFLLWLQQKRMLATDTILGILAHAGLSIGVIMMSLLKQDIELHDYLFGDVLTVTLKEILLIYIGGFVVLTMIVLNWSSLVLMTIHEDMARAENVRTFFIHMLLMFLMTIIVAASIRIVGILLITSMFIIPAATARQLARSPEAMAVLSSLLGGIAVIGGIYASIQFDTPSTPSIVVMSTGLFIILFLITNIFASKS